MTSIYISLDENDLTFSFNPDLAEGSELIFENEISKGKYEIYLTQGRGFLEYSIGHLPGDIDGDLAFIVCDFFGRLSEIFFKTPHENVSKALPQFMRPENDEYVLYPGSFRPWHLGHRECVEQAAANGLNVVICPDRNPWKEGVGVDENPLSLFVSIIDRVKDLKGVSVYSGFLASDKPNPTISWIDKVRTASSKKLLMGDDTFLSIHKWKDADKLISVLSEIVVVPRLASSEQRLRQINKLKEMNSSIEVHVLEKHPYEHLSSTMLRNNS